MDIIEEGFKRCSKCNRVLPITDFNKQKMASDGLQSYCKQCQKAMHAEYYQSNKDALLKKKDDYIVKNKEKIAQKKADYYSKNKERFTDYYNPQTHPMNWAKNIVAQYRKMDRDRGFDPSQTISVDYFINHIANEECKYCHKRGYGLIGCNRVSNLEGHTQNNVVPCCLSCNCRENIRDQLERGIHMSCKHKKQSFSSFVEEHKAKRKNLT